MVTTCQALDVMYVIDETEVCDFLFLFLFFDAKFYSLWYPGVVVYRNKTIDVGSGG